MAEILLETLTIEGIPVLRCLPPSAKNTPVVFFVPGFARTKADGLSLAVRLAQNGIACVSIDPLYHGDRYDPVLEHPENPVYLPEMGLDVYLQFLRVIRQSSLDVRTLLAALVGDSRFDVRRAGVTGHSQGAYASFLAFAELPLRAAVPMMGLPTFLRRWLDLLDECAWSNPAWERHLQSIQPQVEAHTAYLRSIDPAEALHHAAPRALLAMNGDFDSQQPKHYTLEWLRTARQQYAAHPGQLQWNVYALDHVQTPQMEADAVAWFVRHLVDDDT